MNLTGAVMFALTCWIVGLYLVSKFEMSLVQGWFSRAWGGWIGRPFAWMFGGLHSLFRRIGTSMEAWREKRALAAKDRAEKRALRAAMKQREVEAIPQAAVEVVPQPRVSAWKKSPSAKAAAPAVSDAPPFDPTDSPAEQSSVEPISSAEPIEDIPIRMLEYPPSESHEPLAEAAPAEAVSSRHNAETAPRRRMSPFRLPSTELLRKRPRAPSSIATNCGTAAQIKSKFEEFNVRGSVTQINPGPVVTTFEFKPEAGVKYARITTLSEDLCLGLQAESILIERIPGKPTVGIEVPNSPRSDQPASNPGVRGIHRFGLAAHRRARQRYQWPH